MNTKRKFKPKADNRVYEYHIPGRSTLLPGTEVSIQGKGSRRFRFQYMELNGNGDPVLTFIGGRLNGQDEKYVSAYPDRVTRVHRTNKTLVNITKEKGTK